MSEQTKTPQIVGNEHDAMTSLSACCITQNAVPLPPEAGVCVGCGIRIEPVWLGMISARLGWHVPERCAKCQEAQDRQEWLTQERAEIQRLREERLERSGLTHARREKRFTNFTTRPGTEDAVARSEAFAQALISNAVLTKGLFFVGKNGAGKSHLATAILNEVLTAKRRWYGLFVEFADYLATLRQAFHSPDQYKASYLRNAVYNVELLALDDIGAANIKEDDAGDWIREELCRLLNRRIEAQRLLLVTADQGKDELTRRLGARVVSRLYEACEIVPLTPETDYRMTKGEG